MDVTRPTVVLWEPGANVSTCDVASGLASGLEALGVRVWRYPTGVYLELGKKQLHWVWELGQRTQPRPTPAQAIHTAAEPLLAKACAARREYGASWVVVVSGMYQHPDFFVYLRDCGFRVALVLTESPYDIEHEIKVARLVNCVFTNERTAVDALRNVNPMTFYLPHAAPAIASESVRMRTHDVVFVGTYFDERQEFLASIDWTGIDLGLYGGIDQIDKRTRDGRRLAPFCRGGFTQQPETLGLYDAARVGLNLHRTSKGFRTGQYITHAESLNPRCYELAARGAFFVSDARAELAEVFPAVPTFTTPAECEALMRRALSDEPWRAGVAADTRAAAQAHDWHQRAVQVWETLQSVARGAEVAA